LFLLILAHVHTSVFVQLLLSSSSSSSPLCRVFILIFLTQTVSLGNTVLQLFCCYYSRCLYRLFQCWICCTFTLVLIIIIIIIIINPTNQFFFSDSCDGLQLTSLQHICSCRVRVKGWNNDTAFNKIIFIFPQNNLTHLKIYFNYLYLLNSTKKKLFAKY
jgi:hypothetical protein